ncbi:MAG TPA: hypothetical protein VE090_02550 [Methylomirabilota bacterium]|nr:hypothetical protein [Methylomirabilota bacterium]
MKIEYEFQITYKKTKKVSIFRGVSYFKVLPEGMFYIEYPEVINAKNMTAAFKSEWLPLADIESINCSTIKNFSNHAEFAEFLNPKKKLG